MQEPVTERKTPPLRLVMFRFLCPLCGANPGPRLLRDYLQEWANAPVERVNALVGGLDSALRHYAPGRPCWTTMKFLKSVTGILESTEQVQRLLERLATHLTSASSASCCTDLCAVCEMPSGVRGTDRYFTDWEQACRVQTGNLLYEIEVILWRIVREVPGWCGAHQLSSLDRLRKALHVSSRAIGGLTCPVCRRPTTHLYGTTRRFCRWCLDMSRGFGVGVGVGTDGSLELVEPDPTRAAFEDADLLPPVD